MISTATHLDIYNDAEKHGTISRLGDSLLEQEALAALREVAFAVQSVSLSESLPLTSELVFMNLTTLEGLLLV